MTAGFHADGWMDEQVDRELNSTSQPAISICDSKSIPFDVEAGPVKFLQMYMINH